jgi:uncharacterized protein YecE (DUF72 family)
VAADPAPVAGAGEPRGWQELRYYRLHGSPRIYYTVYSSETLATTAERLVRDTVLSQTRFLLAYTGELALAGGWRINDLAPSW